MVCLCLWLLHASLSPPLTECFPSECPRHPGLGMLRAEVGERSPGVGEACKCAEPPPTTKGTPCWIHCCSDFFPPEYPLTQRTSRKPSDYVLAILSIISLFRGLEWVAHASNGWSYSTVVMIKILNQLPNQYTHLPMISGITVYLFCFLPFTHTPEAENGIEPLMTPNPTTPQYGLKSLPATHP